MAPWSTLSSLYETISVQDGAALDEAVKYRNWGLYDEALNIFETCLKSIQREPIVAIELSLLHERRGFEVLRSETLQDALDYLDTEPKVAEESVIWLLKIMKASCAYYTTGHVRPSLDIARALQRWLLNVDARQYTDVMVSCIQYYHSIVKLTESHSDWNQDNDGNLPMTNERTTAASLRYLRRLLMDQGRAEEASMLVRDEARATTGLDACLPYREFLHRYDNSTLDSDSLLAFRVVSSKLFLAEALAEAKEFEDARAALDEARGTMLSALLLPCAFSNPRLWILLENAAPYTSEIERSPTKLAQCLHVAKLAGEAKEYHVQRSWLINAYNVVDFLAGQGHNLNRWPNHARRRQEVLQQLLDFELRSGLGPVFLASTLNSISHDMRLASRSAELLEYLGKFWELYPNFDLPHIAYRMVANACPAAHNVGDKELVGQWEERKQRLHPFRAGADDSNLFNKYDFKDGSAWLYDWKYLPDGIAESASILDKRLLLSSMFILHWLPHDLERGQVTKQTAILIAQIDCAVDSDPVEHIASQIRQLEPNKWMQQIYGVQGLASPPPEWNSWFTVCEDWLRRTDLPPSVPHRHYLLYVVAWCRGMTLNGSKQGSDDNGESALNLALARIQWKKNERRIANTIHESLDVGWQQRLIFDSDEATQLMLLANNNVARERGIATVETLQKAIDIKAKLILEYEARSNHVLLYYTRTSRARALWMKHIHFKACPANELLPDLEEADRLFRKMVAGRSIAPSLTSFMAEHTLFEDLDHWQVLQLAWTCSCRAWLNYIAANPELVKNDMAALTATREYQTLAIDFVAWSQKIKARSLTDLLGMGAQYPEGLARQIQESDFSIEIINRYDKLNSQLDEAMISDRILIREQMSKLEEEMRNDQHLSSLLDILQGITVRHEQLVEMCSDLDVVFIDWLKVDWLDNIDLAFAFYKNGVFGDIIFLKSLKFKDVEDWVQTNLEPDSALVEDSKFQALNDRTAQRQLNKMNDLANLFQFVAKPGQTIVISAIGALHRIPFHALRCDGQPLIERNPVVYCQSFTVLRYCLLSRYRLVESVPEIFRPAVFNPLSNEKNTSQMVEDVAREFGVQVQNPSTMEKADFIKAMEEASLIHFHGHVRFDESNPLAHHLELACLESGEEQPDAELPPEKILTSQDVFGIKLKAGAHLTTISCKSARAQISNANEQLGLLTAFHYAGASSAISTLWNIHRDDGARFAKAFYESFLGDLVDESGENGTFVNMARAMQQAILAVRRDENGNVQSPYHWAGFVFNGAWIFPRPHWVHASHSEPDTSEEGMRSDVEKLTRRGTW